MTDLRGRRDEALAPESEPTSVTMVGILRLLDVEGGVWALEVDHGDRVQLLGAIDPGLAGRRVAVTGMARPDQASSAQVGPVLELGAIEPA